MGKLAGIGFAVLYTIVAIVVAVVVNYQNSCRYDAIVNRAQVAAQIDDIQKYLEQYKSNLEQAGKIRGHTAIIFKKPDNDLALHYEALGNLIERCDEVKDLPHTETAYQQALDDIRGIARELEFVAAGITWVSLHWLVWLGIAIWVFAIIALRPWDN